MKNSLKSIIREEVRRQLNEQDPRDVMKNPESPMPFVNLNGNNKDSLIEQSYNVIEALENAIKAVSKCDVFHGRNGMDEDHRKVLRDKRVEVIQKLRDFDNYFDDIIRYIDNLERVSTGR